MSRTKNQKISDVLGNLGFAFEFFKAIADACVTRGGTMQQLRRVVNNRTLQDQLAILIVPPLGENEYLVHVEYDMPRDKGVLEEEFSKGYVSKLFYGKNEWQLHTACVEIDQTPGERVMLVKCFERNTTSKANIAEMDKQGYRPATHLEAYAFAKANPEIQRKFWIFALGSTVMEGEQRVVVALHGEDGRRFLDCHWYRHGWKSDARFLFVRKDS